MNEVTFEVVGDSVPVTADSMRALKLPDHPANLKFSEWIGVGLFIRSDNRWP